MCVCVCVCARARARMHTYLLECMGVYKSFNVCMPLSLFYHCLSDSDMTYLTISPSWTGPVHLISSRDDPLRLLTDTARALIIIYAPFGGRPVCHVPRLVHFYGDLPVSKKSMSIYYVLVFIIMTMVITLTMISTKMLIICMYSFLTVTGKCRSS